jgi:hypothetical protein
VKEFGQSLRGLEQGCLQREEGEGKRKVMQAYAARVLHFAVLETFLKKINK